jgi:membrane associated rhomboid family serine protease
MPSSRWSVIESRAALLLGVLSVMWAVEVVDFVLPFVDLDRFGIRPRSVAGLSGILFAPFLHGGFGHLVANSLPLLALGGMVLLGGDRVFRKVSLWVVLCGGFGVWLLGRGNSVHIGASLLVFGYLGFLLSRGIAERSGTWVLVSIVVLLVYGGALYGLLPGRPGVSWLGHVCGFVAGVSAAWLMFPKGGRMFGRPAG